MLLCGGMGWGAWASTCTPHHALTCNDMVEGRVTQAHLPYARGACLPEPLLAQARGALL